MHALFSLSLLLILTGIFPASSALGKSDLLHPQLQVPPPNVRPHDYDWMKSPLLFRTTRELTPAEITQMEKKGVLFKRHRGEISHVGRHYSVSLTPEGLHWLRHSPLADQLAPGWPTSVQPNPPTLPQEFTEAHQDTDLLAARGLRDPQGERITGTGQILCDIDSGIDPFHPLFFYADGGRMDWVDADASGAFELGTDGVDLNENGTLEETEVFSAFGGSVLDLYTLEAIDPDPQFTANRDWLYLDLNGNGKRDAGFLKGFEESTPAYGEPLFVVEDINQNNQINVGEKLLRLGTSKIVGYHDTPTGHTFRRGVDLIEVVPTDEYSHGTGVAGILVGGVSGTTAIEGVAPGAEVFMISTRPPVPTESGEGQEDDTTLLQSIEHCRDAGSLIFVHEYGAPNGQYGDGTDVVETLIDALTAEGITQLTATHNFAGYRSHGEIVVEPGATESVPIEVFPADYAGYEPSYLNFTLRWRDAPLSAADFTIQLGDTTITPIGNEETHAGDFYYWATRGTSSRETHMVVVAVARVPEGDTWTQFIPIAEDDLTVTVTNSEDIPFTLVLDVGDETGYAPALSLPDGVETKVGTIAHPATADSAISIGAQACNEHIPGYETEKGLKYFSGQGPRIDGEQGIDLTAPEDHFTAMVTTPWSPAGPGTYGKFGGTSGALPQAAGTVALMLQKNPNLTPEEVKAALQAAATEDSYTGATPNTAWGFGKLNAYKSLTGLEAPEYNPPVATWQQDGDSYAGLPTTLDASWSADPNHSLEELIYRWDIDHDGTWDETRSGDPSFSPTFESPGSTWVLLEVEDPEGYWDQFLAKVTTVEAPEEPPTEVTTPTENTEGPTESGLDTEWEPEEEENLFPDFDDLGEDDPAFPFTPAPSGATSSEGGCAHQSTPGHAKGILFAFAAVALLCNRRRETA